MRQKGDNDTLAYETGLPHVRGMCTTDVGRKSQRRTKPSRLGNPRVENGDKNSLSGSKIQRIKAGLQVHLKHIRADSLSNGFQQVKPGTVNTCSAVQCSAMQCSAAQALRAPVSSKS